MKTNIIELNNALKKFDQELTKANRKLKVISAKLGLLMKQKLNGNDVTELARAMQHKLLNIYLALADQYEKVNLKFKALREEFDWVMSAHSKLLTAKRKESKELLMKMKDIEKPVPEKIVGFAADIRNIFEGLVASYTKTFDTIVEVRDVELKLMRRDDKLSQALGKLEAMFGIIESFQSAENIKFDTELDYLRRLKEEKIRPYIR